MVHGVEAHAEDSGVEELMYGIEVEEGLHQLGVVGHWVDDLDGHPIDLKCSDPIEVHVRGVNGEIAVDPGGAYIDGARHALGELWRDRPVVLVFLRHFG